MIDGDKWMDREVYLHRFEQRERRDGPRYCEAIRGAREMREERLDDIFDSSPLDLTMRYGAASAEERERGLPEGWIAR